MKYDGIVLFSDLDGTLLDKERKLSKTNAEAVSYFVSNGGTFGVATGRMERTTIINFPELKINTPSIFFNGALIWDTGSKEILYKKFLPDGLVPIFRQLSRRYPKTTIEINTLGCAYVFNWNEIVTHQLEREGLEGIEVPWEQVPSEWIKVLLMDRHDTLEQIKDELEKMEARDLSIVFSEKELLDVMAQGVSKGNAITYLRNRSKENWKLVFAMGDNENDYEMLKAADVGIAVENARPLVKEAAKHHVGSNDTPCMPEVLKIIDSYL